jgi:hypothetical protein
MVVAQTWRTYRRPEFSAGFSLAVRRLGFRMRKYPARAKPRPITLGEEVIHQLRESDNDDRDQRTRVQSETFRTTRAVRCAGQKKSNRPKQAAIMKDRSSVASIGQALVAIEAAFSPRLTQFASLAPLCAVDRPCRFFVVDAARRLREVN